MYKEKFLKKTRGLRHIIRFIQSPKCLQQDVSQHSFYVILYTKYICDKMGIDNKTKLCAIEEAILHDISESVSVDLPANVKRKAKKESKEIEKIALGELLIMPDFDIEAAEKEATSKLIVKSADLIDAYVYSREEEQMGNNFFKPICAEILTTLKSWSSSLGIIVGNNGITLQQVINAIIEEFESQHVIKDGEIDYESMTHIHKI
jgi:5'-deoxynucleotidase YfbR-like HD superfamily hydrolase